MRLRRVLAVVGLPAAAALAAALALDIAGLHLVRITSASMEPAVMTGGLVLVRERPVAIEELERGGIALFRFPLGSDAKAIKRVVALPGDVVEVRDDAVLVNGSRIPAPLPPAQPQPAARSTIGPDSVFLLGDNAPASVDSRSFGAVPVEEILGTVVFVLPSLTW